MWLSRVRSRVAVLQSQLHHRFMQGTCKRSLFSTSSLAFQLLMISPPGSEPSSFIEVLAFIWAFFFFWLSSLLLWVGNSGPRICISFCFQAWYSGFGFSIPTCLNRFFFFAGGSLWEGTLHQIYGLHSCGSLVIIYRFCEYAHD